MKNKGIGAEQCYLALVLIEEVISKGGIFKRNKELKRWLMKQFLLVNDNKRIGVRTTKRIFWSLSVENGFIGRNNKRIVITEEGYKFFRADEFKRVEMFLDGFYLNFKKDEGGKNKSIEKSAIVINKEENKSKQELIYKSIKDIDVKKSQGGLIYTLMGVDSHENGNRSSAIYEEINVCSDCHRDSKTPEIYWFDADSGKGFIRVGEELLPVGPKTFVFVPEGAAHYLVPSAGQILKAIVVSPRAWEKEEDFIRGKAVSDSAPSGI